MARPRPRDVRRGGVGGVLGRSAVRPRRARAAAEGRRRRLASSRSATPRIPCRRSRAMGANSALFVAAWASRTGYVRARARAVACFEREMMARAWVKVRASRDACVSFHSRIIVDAPAEFAGVDPKEAPEFLDELEARRQARRGQVKAAMGGETERIPRRKTRTEATASSPTPTSRRETRPRARRRRRRTLVVLRRRRRRTLVVLRRRRRRTLVVLRGPAFVSFKVARARFRPRTSSRRRRARYPGS